MIRIGTVVEANSEDRTVRVSFYEADDLVSDWLKVISTPPAVACEIEGEETPEASVTVTAWMPELGATVICLYEDEPNADGYVIGGLS